MTRILVSGSEISGIRDRSKFTSTNTHASNLDDCLRHEQSVSRSSGWADTLDARRAQFESERILQRAADESVRQAIDMQEAKIQFAKRQDDIRRANQLLFQESDRMKLLHSSMMMSDVLAERESQIKIKSELKKLEVIRARKYEELAKHHNTLLMESDKQADADHINKKKMLAKEQLEQLNAAKDRRIAEIKANIVEGEQLKSVTEEFLKEEIKTRSSQRQARLAAQQELLAAQESLKALKYLELKNTREEDLKIQEHAVELERIAANRKERNVQALKEKQEVRQRLIDRQAEKLSELRDNEEERVAQHCRNAEDEQNTLLQQRLMKLNAWKKDIEVSRLTQVASKEAKKAMRIEEERRASEFSNLVFKRQREEEEQAVSEHKAAQVQLAADLQKQMSTTKATRLAEQKREVATVGRAIHAVNREVKEFQTFTEHAILEYSTAGKNVVPIVNALKSFHKNANQ